MPHQEGGWRKAREGGGGGEKDLHFKPPAEDLCGQICLSLSPSLCPSLALSLMLSFCLALTDLLRGRDQNESPAPSSSLAFAPSSSTDSFSSLVLSQSFLVPWPEKLPSWALKKKWEKRGMRRWRQEQRGAERMRFLFLSLWSTWKGFSLLTHEHTNSSLSVLFCTWSYLLCVPLANFRGDFLEGTKNSMSASRAGTCLPRQMFSYSSPHRCFMLYSKLMTCLQKTFNFDRWGYFSIAIFHEVMLPITLAGWWQQAELKGM